MMKFEKKILTIILSAIAIIAGTILFLEKKHNDQKYYEIKRIIDEDFNDSDDEDSDLILVSRYEKALLKFQPKFQLENFND